MKPIAFVCFYCLFFVSPAIAGQTEQNAMRAVIHALALKPSPRRYQLTPKLKEPPVCANWGDLVVGGIAGGLRKPQGDDPYYFFGKWFGNFFYNLEPRIFTPLSDYIPNESGERWTMDWVPQGVPASKSYRLIVHSRNFHLMLFVPNSDQR